MKNLLNRAWEALKYAAARGRKAIGAALGGLTGEAVVRLADEWLNLQVDATVAAVIAFGAAALGAWLAPANAPKKETVLTRG